MQTREWTRRDHGATAVEYALLVAMIGLVIATAVTQLGLSLEATFARVDLGVSEQPADDAPVSQPVPAEPQTQPGTGGASSSGNSGSTPATPGAGSGNAPSWTPGGGASTPPRGGRP